MNLFFNMWAPGKWSHIEVPREGCLTPKKFGLALICAVFFANLAPALADPGEASPGSPANAEIPAETTDVIVFKAGYSIHGRVQAETNEYILVLTDNGPYKFSIDAVREIRPAALRLAPVEVTTKSGETFKALYWSWSYLDKGLHYYLTESQFHANQLPAFLPVENIGHVEFLKKN